MADHGVSCFVWQAMRPAAFIGMLALATGLGGVLLAELAVLPGIETQTHLVDANLAKALSGPLHLRMSEIVLAAALLLAAVVPRWLGSKLATTTALLTVAAATIHRVLLLPAAYAAWSRADRVAGRPVERILEAERFTDKAHWVSATIVVLLIGLAWLASAAHRLRTSGSDTTGSEGPVGTIEPTPRADSPTSAAA